MAQRKRKSGTISENPKGRELGTSVDGRSGGVYIRGGKVHVDGSLIGRDMIVINLPALTGRFALIGLAALAVIAGAFFLWHAIQGLKPMGGIFNIAIAQFGQIDDRGQVVEWRDGASLSESIGFRVRNELEAIPDLKGVVQIRYGDIGLIQGATSMERKEVARRLAENLRANLLIYGNLVKQAEGSSFVPEFYIRDLKGAEELLGPGQLGSPVTSSAPIILSDKLKGRTQALTIIAMGLTYLYLFQPKDDDAVKWFEQALQVGGWSDSEGKEILYLFLGTAYRNRGKDGDSLLARTAYRKAVSLNPEYARAYIGLGNVSYDEYQNWNRDDLSKLDEAADWYEQAEKAKDKPTAARVEATIHVSLGNVYIVKAQNSQPDLFPKAQFEFQQVITEYEQGKTELRDVATHCYLGMGIVQERWKNDYQGAAEYYRKSIATAGDNKQVRRLAEIQLKAMEKQSQGTSP